MLNMDFTQRVVVETAQAPWVASPSGGVWRKPLEKAQAESGWTTSIVRYDAGSAFKTHTHPMGEELFVLEGVFSDETGDYPAGSYLRNPPGSAHAPFSREGCVLFVKLDHFREGDNEQVRINTHEQPWLSGYGGEEIFVLSGVFQDEHGAYPTHTWMRSPHLSQHHPFVNEPTLILVKTGHLPTA
jgi:anti-sigma factor ChrR (cupin superfamily)